MKCDDNKIIIERAVAIASATAVHVEDSIRIAATTPNDEHLEGNNFVYTFQMHINNKMLFIKNTLRRTRCV